MAAQHDMVSKFGAAAIVVMLMLVVPNSGSGEDAGHDKDQLAPMSSEAEFGFSLPIVHGRPPAPGMDDEKFVTPFRIYEDVAYLAEMEIGERQQKQYLLIDTGSSLVWTQCDECPHCHIGDVPPYGRSQSRTFQEVSCGDDDDNDKEEAIASYCPAKPPGYITLCVNGRCMFKALYNLTGQGETVQGYMSMDTFHFIDDRRFDYQAKFRMVFGCAHQENIVLTAVKECTGILGLGMGDASFLRQTGITKFSYCAPPRMPGYSYRRHSWLRFGSHAQISGKKVPLVMRWGKYYLPLTAITYTYNELMSPVPIIAYKSQEDYLHMMVDTGTSLLSLPTSLHDDLIKEMEAIIKSENIMEGATRWPKHCYKRTMDEVKDITVTLSFDGGLDIELFTSALFIKTETTKGPAVCLAVNRVDDSSKAILGMFAQTNINVGYDLLSREIAMDPIRCA